MNVPMSVIVKYDVFLNACMNVRTYMVRDRRDHSAS